MLRPIKNYMSQKAFIYGFIFFLIGFFSVATHLRIGHLPLGFGEIICLLVLGAFVVWHKTFRLGALPIFWVVFLLSTILGLIWSRPQNPWMFHNGFAYCYALAFCLLFQFLLAAFPREQAKVFFRTYSLMSLGVLTFAYFVFLTGSSELKASIGLAEYFRRFTGWSTNPNQLAFFLIAFPVLFLSVPFEKYSRVILLLITFWIGLAVRSDALFLGWAVGLVSMLIFAAIWKQRDLIIRSALGLSLLGVVFGVQKAFLFVGSVESDSILGVGYGTDKVGVRSTLWKNAFDVWLESPVFGHGPGIFSFYEKGGEKVEAHNLLLDVLTQGGVIGALILSGLFLYVVRVCILRRDAAAIALLGALVIFSGAHFMLRHPLFSAYLMICLYGLKPFRNEA